MAKHEEAATLTVGPHVESRPMGRPSDYRAEFCETIVALGVEGKSRTQMAASLGVVRETLGEWAKVHPEFSDAMTRALAYSAAWWEDQGQKGIWAGSDFNANAYRLQVTNRFPSDWRDKQDVEHGVTSELASLLSLIDGKTRGVPEK